MGALWWWGSPWSLGVSAEYAPVQLGTVDTWACISFGYAHGAGVREDGTLWVWGEGGSGELGLNSFTDQATPVQVGSATNWAWVSCGYAHTLAIKTDGTLWATGACYSGQCAQGNTTDLDEFTQVGSATDWAKAYAIGDSSFVIKTSGALHACGDNSFGHLGDGTTTQRNSLVPIGSAAWAEIAGDLESISGRQTNDTLWTWGNGANGRLGLGNTTTYHTPQQVGSDTWLSAGIGDNSVGIKSAGTLWQWGAGTTAPVQVGTATDWAWCSVSAVGNFAARTSGALYSWYSGANTYGQLGQGDTASYPTPTRIGTATGWALVSGQYSTLFARLDAADATGQIMVDSPLGAAALLGGVATRAPHRYRLTAYLSGGEDAESDYPITLISFGLNKRSGSASYYSLSAPFSQALIDAFAARPNGIVHVWRDGRPWESFNVAHPVRYDIGPRSASISVSGTRQVTLAASATMAIDPVHVIDESINGEGLLTLELVPGYFDPRPNDVMTWGGNSYTVTLKRFQANAAGQTLSISAEAV